jgi:rod shape-determining protein MreD
MKMLAIWGSKRTKSKSKSSQRKSEHKPQSRNSQQQKTKTHFKPIASWQPRTRAIVDYLIMFSSVMLCLMMLPTRLPGMELLGIGPNWLLIWVVAWSVKRSAWQGALAGVILGLLQDAMTSSNPTHALSLGLVGLITSLMQKQRFIQEDFISIALIVFVMAGISETLFALQLVLSSVSLADGTQYYRVAADVWMYFQKVALASAILSSLWAPVVYFPLNRWWQKLKSVEQA